LISSPALKLRRRQHRDEFPLDGSDSDDGAEETGDTMTDLVLSMLTNMRAGKGMGMEKSGDEAKDDTSDDDEVDDEEPDGFGAGPVLQLSKKQKKKSRDVFNIFS
jgi:hypothetical protein